MFLSAFADSATVARVRELGAVAYLVKPLDIAQIVPTVEAAVANVRKQGDAAPPAPAQAGRPAAAAAPAARPMAPADTDPLASPVPLAVGVLMHRYSLPRAEALERLRRLAVADGRPLAVQAAALLDAVELLSRPGQ
jgi:response regulator NasT